MSDELGQLAELIRVKNEVDVAIAQLIGRPCERGNIGEFVAARVFATRLMASGSHPGHDGVFEERPLVGKTVNVKTYSRYVSMGTTSRARRSATPSFRERACWSAG